MIYINIEKSDKHVSQLCDADMRRDNIMQSDNKGRSAEHNWFETMPIGFLRAEVVKKEKIIKNFNG